jgi:hypothetical protein
MFVVLPFPRTERQQGFALKEYPMATETNLWRAVVVDVAPEATGQLASINTLSYSERDKERWAISAAKREGDDVALMQALKLYCPDAPHLLMTYQARDDNTADAPSSSSSSE